MEREHIRKLKSLTPDLLNELFEILPSMRYIVTDPQSQQISIWSAKEHKCPNCDSKNFNKNGHRKNGAQKFICKDCGKSFSMSTNTVGFWSHSNIEKWMKFIECEINGFSHRKTAAIVGIHRNTALLWRHKFYDALMYLQKTSMSNVIQLDTKTISINFEKQKRNDKSEVLKRHNSSNNQDKNFHTVCVAGAVDNENHLILKVAESGKEMTEMYKSFSNQIKKDSILIVNEFQRFEILSKELKCQLQKIDSELCIDEGVRMENSVTQIHSELEMFLKKYHSISIRNLQGYLNMFVLLKRLRCSFDSCYHVREAWLAGIPFETTIRRRNDSSKPYSLDINGEYLNCSELNGIQSFGVA